MLTTLTDVIDHKNLNVIKKKSKKTQIFLFDTLRRFDEYVSKLKYRDNGKYEDIPHFIISKTGLVYEVFNTNYSSITFNNPEIDKKLIKVAIENLGWLNKNTINGFLYNWIGDIYRLDPYCKEWRGHYYWDIYTDKQYDSINELCKVLTEKHNIPYNVVPSHSHFSDSAKFKGIICKSNYSDIYTDINPSFNFNILLKNDEKRNELR